MSDEIDIEGNNLCASEEAFECFQAQSTYEEDEFITLSDILPPQPQFPDLASTIEEMPSEGDVVSLTFEDKAPETHARSLDSNVQIENIVTTDQNVLEHEINSKSRKKQRTRRRGAKAGFTTSKKRQGRKTVKTTKCFEPNLQISDNTNKKPNMSNDMESVSRPNDKKSSSKRGRKPKNLLHVTDNKLEVNITPNEQLSEFEVDILTNETTDTPIKTRGKRKTVNGNRITNENKETNKIELFEDPNLTLLNDNNQYLDESMENKSPKRKRKFNKKYTASLTETNHKKKYSKKQMKSKVCEPPKDTIMDQPNKSDDDLDDMSLSSLKQTFDSVLPDSELPFDNEICLSNTKQIIDDKNEYKDTQNIIDVLEGNEITTPHIENNTIIDYQQNVSVQHDIQQHDNQHDNQTNENVQYDEYNTNEKTAPQNESIPMNTKRNSKMPVMSDFEYNIDKVIRENSSVETGDVDVNSGDLNSNIEDSYGRPKRRNTQKTINYGIDSDEDPFANVESSDDEPRKKKGYRYDSDHEYRPGKDKNHSIASDSSDLSAAENNGEDFSMKKKRKRVSKKSSLSPKKKRQLSSLDCETGEINNTNYIDRNEDSLSNLDIEVSLESSAIKPTENIDKKTTTSKWGSTQEFENFLAKKLYGNELKIKKTPHKTIKTPLEIPVLNTEDLKKCVDVSVQTTVKSTSSNSTQTVSPYTIPMKSNVSLTSNQSGKACEFLKNIVKTTTELGQLMVSKSEDFIKRKINTDHVIDTVKMDYCVNKSFLLFKLAKHNLTQMEEDLAKQYEEFLNDNNLSHCREQQKKIEPQKKSNSDSDCEIVEVLEEKSKEKAKFNPKTVFLNKELSIKIAKKPNKPQPVKQKAKDNINIKGNKSVWINDSVVVKKVKPTQSFLAQDSRNKKPPDNKVIIEHIVKEFFTNYERLNVERTLAPFVSADWLSVQTTYICSYFVHNGISDHENSEPTSFNGDVAESVHLNGIENNNFKSLVSPQTLVSLCTAAITNTMSTKQIQVFGQTCESEIVTCPNDTVKNYLNLQSTAKQSSIDPKQCLNKTFDISSEVVSIRSLKILCHQRILKYMFYDNKEVKEHIPAVNKKKVKSLITLCTTVIQEIQRTNLIDQELFTVRPLKQISFEKIRQLLYCTSIGVNHTEEHLDTTEDFVDDYSVYQVKKLTNICSKVVNKIFVADLDAPKHHVDDYLVYHVKKLTDICSKVVNEIFVADLDVPKHQVDGYSVYQVKKLSDLCFKVVSKIFEEDSDPPEDLVNEYLAYQVQKLADICFKVVSKSFEAGPTNFENKVSSCINEICLPSNSSKNELCLPSNSNKNETCLPSTILTIDAVNTVSEEAFTNMEGTYFSEEESQFLDEDNYDYEQEFESELLNNSSLENTENSNWAGQVQMQEVISGKTNKEQVHRDPLTDDTQNMSLISQLKTEPLEEIENVDQTIIKSEPLPIADDITVIPANIVTKSENIENQNNNREEHIYDMTQFEQFARSNKIMHSFDDSSTDGIYSQSSFRVRRQHEPDSDPENDIGMSLLIPQTFEPLNIETAKGNLMEDSSGSNTEDINKRINTKESKKKKRKLKKGIKEVPNSVKEKPCFNEVAVMTRRMKERIRQEEKKIASSDSESENLPLSMKKKESKKDDRCKGNSSKNINDNLNIEIQCNNVDSTAQVTVSPNSDVNFSGFSAIDQNEITSYQKYVNYVYKQIIPNDLVTEVEKNRSETKNIQSEVDKSQSEVIISQSRENERNSIKNIEGIESEIKNNSSKPEFDCNLFSVASDAPVEMLECEPTLPIFENDNEGLEKRNSKKIKKPHKTKENLKVPEKIIEKEQGPLYTERFGWYCYPIQSHDTKLYQAAQILLEKLPESFVETYFEYQGITNRNKEDNEIDRLTNLQSLNRASNVAKSNTRTKTKTSVGDQSSSMQDDHSRTASPAHSDHYAELTPSEDEGGNIDDEVPVAKEKVIENNLAKTSLMDDGESEEEKLSSREKVKNEQSNVGKPKKAVPKKAEPKKAEAQILGDTDSLMLTADKMMNKELALLHAPVVLTDVPEDVKDKNILIKETSTKYKTRHSKRPHSYHDKDKLEDEYSEEEKQWVSTKEKLLKRMGRKQEDTSVDDAKRAKIVIEFLEKRKSAPELGRKNNKGRKAKLKHFRRKKLLEQQKQLRILSKELLGESSIPYGKKNSQAYFKGRRNIRKVLNKKSLAASTVASNMEEFERKSRLIAKQNKLREVLGCEEGVSVLVINDEVCLEYNFEELRPIVTVHPFFTKVMKAHQYEGVKFMWDACFESVSMVESGHAGGGCILAHCMGLGKTLQVLALLHTVLTQPRLGMQRVLVCCPLSTVLNWVDEIHKWIGPVTDEIKVFELSKLKKTYERAYQLEDWYKGGGIFIIGYELFRSLSLLDPLIDNVKVPIVNKIRTALLDPGPDIIVCDEGHLLKNDASVLAVAMSRVVTKRRIVLTGTPMQNNLREYYCMVNFVKPHLLGTYSEYSNRFENPIMNGQHRDSREEDIKLMKARTHILHKVLEGCLQRQEVSVLYPYLPKKHEYTVFIPLTKCQSDLYKHYLFNYAKQSKNNILKDFHTLQKIWSHPQVLHNFHMKARTDGEKLKVDKLEDDLAHEDLAASEDVKPSETEVWWLQYLDGGQMLDSLETSNKFLAVFRILDECVALEDKVLIFSTSLFTMDALEYFLKRIKQWRLGHDYYRLDGSVPPEVRQKWCREFNAQHNVDTKLFLISTRAGSLGLNMTAANRVIILDTSWNPAHDIQSIFRVYRFGQKKDCYIYRLVALGTMEQKIYERSVTKQAVACRVVDEQQIDRHYNSAELTELYTFDEMGVCVAAGVAAGVCDVALLRVARDAAVHAVHEHDSLLRGSSEQCLPEHERDAAWMQFEQEHQHKQIQNRLRLPKIFESIQDHSYTSKTTPPSISPKIKEEIFEETDNLKDADYTPGYEKKKDGQNRAKKLAIKKEKQTFDCQPSTSQHHSANMSLSMQNQSLDENIIERVTQILVQHNFSDVKDISKLISNVKKCVSSGRQSDLDECDELTKSIAKVLLERNPPPMPALTDVQPTITNKVDNNVTGQDILPKKKLNKPGPKSKNARFVYESNSDMVNRPSELEAIPSFDSYGRTKRKAAVAAEKSFESFSKNSIIDLDDDDWNKSSDTDTADEEHPNPVQATELNEPVPTCMPNELFQTKKPFEQVQAKKGCKPAQTRKLGETHVEPPKSKKGKELPNVSILLSDDDELSFVDPPTDKPNKNLTNEGVKAIRTVAEVKKEMEVERKKVINVTRKIPDKSIKSTNVNQGDSEERGVKTIKTVAEVKKEMEAERKKAINIIRKVPDDSIKLINVNQKSKVSAVNEEDKVPLHPSLLTNKNFVKIVAHTYLAGNSMLDEDAANLAADYSTSKALQEIESTGKNLTSGPIYDIAVKVLGIDILKKLQTTNPKTTDNLSPSLDATLNPPKEINVPKTVSKLEQSKPIKQSDEGIASGSGRKVQRLTNPPARGVPMTTTVSAGLPPAKVNTSAPPDIVPVGLIQRATNALPVKPTIFNNECILPDDDDIHIISDTTASVPNIINPTKPIIIMRNDKPRIINNKLLEPSTSNTPTLEIVNDQIVSHIVAEPIAPANPSKGRESISANDFTISLDSDDEDVLPSVQLAAPFVTQIASAPHIPPDPYLTPAPQHTPAPQAIPVAIASTPPVPQYISAPARQTITLIPNSAQSSMKQNFVLIPSSGSQLTQVSPEVVANAFRNIPPEKIHSLMTPLPAMQTLPRAHQYESPQQKTSEPASFETTHNNDIIQIGENGTFVIVGRKGQNSVASKQGVPKQSEPQQTAPNQSAPQQNTPKQSAPQQNTPKQSAPQQNTPKQSVPQQNAPKRNELYLEITSKSSTKNPQPLENKRTEQRSRKISSSSSSSDDSRPASPSDPLSLFKNVIQIQGPDVCKASPNKTSTNMSNSIYYIKSNTPAPIVKQTNATPNYGADKIKHLLNNERGNKNQSHESLRKADLFISKCNPASDNNSKKNEKSTTNTNSNKKGIASKPTTVMKLVKTNPNSVVDLTEIDVVTKSSSSIKNTKITTHKDSRDSKKRVDDFMKTIVKNRGSMAISKNSNVKTAAAKNTPKITTSQVSVKQSVTSVPSTSKTKPPSEPVKNKSTLKRPNPVVVKTETKKKKSEPMSLQDFDIDDMDDIIELE